MTTLVAPEARIALIWSLKAWEVIVETLPSDRQMLPRPTWTVLSKVESIELPKELSQGRRFPGPYRQSVFGIVHESAERACCPNVCSDQFGGARLTSRTFPTK